MQKGNNNSERRRLASGSWVCEGSIVANRNMLRAGWRALSIQVFKFNTHIMLTPQAISDGLEHFPRHPGIKEVLIKSVLFIRHSNTQSFATPLARTPKVCFGILWRCPDQMVLRFIGQICNWPTNQAPWTAGMIMEICSKLHWVRDMVRGHSY